MMVMASKGRWGMPEIVRGGFARSFPRLRMLMNFDEMKEVTLLSKEQLVDIGADLRKYPSALTFSSQRMGSLRSTSHAP